MIELIMLDYLYYIVYKILSINHCLSIEENKEGRCNFLDNNKFKNLFHLYKVAKIFAL